MGDMANLMDYGVAVGGLLIVLILLLRYMFPRIDKDFLGLQQATEANTNQISALTQAIEGQTKTVERVLSTCEKAFDDNRQTVKLLIEHIERSNSIKTGE